MGTVAFSGLPELTAAAAGDMYNISDEFTTTDDFKEGSGNAVPAGANIYKTSDGKWDVLAGTPVTGVKGAAENIYRRGNVDITPANIGLGNVDNTSDVNKPVSREQQRVIDEKHRMSTDYTDQKVAEAKAENKNVVDALNNAIGMKADNGHNHDDRYYTEGEVNGLLANKADSNHTHAWGTLTGTPSTFPPTPHAHDYLPLTGGTVNGNLAVTGNFSSDRYYTATPNQTMVIESGGFVNIQTGQSAQVRTYGDTGWAAISAREFVQQSSRKYKENIKDMTEEYARKLLELRPVSYDYKNKEDGVDCYGLIAEEVDEVESYPVFYNDAQEPEGIDYSKFGPQIIKMLQIHERDIRKLMEK